MRKIIAKLRQVLKTYELTRFDEGFRISFSQVGEDIALLSIIETLREGIRRGESNGNSLGFYVDVGAYHPNKYSNTRMLYDLGWHGINIEANPDREIEFRKLRPRDIYIPAAVGTAKNYELTRFHIAALSTTKTLWAEEFQNKGYDVRDTISVPGISLYEILAKVEDTKSVDLLLVDAEGSDLDILESMNFPNLEPRLIPKILVLETRPPVINALQMPAVKLAIDWGYEAQVVLSSSTILTFKS